MMDQLRAHCAIEISELEMVVGSQQELSAALHQTFPQLVTEIRHIHLFSEGATRTCVVFIMPPFLQVALNQAHTETLNCATDALSATMKEQSGLMEEVCLTHEI